VVVELVPAQTYLTRKCPEWASLLIFNELLR
jgi:hypothetical protein